MIVFEEPGPAEAVLLKLTQQIREEFEDAPGLRITIDDASRLWGLDKKTCGHVLARLLATGFLARGVDERYRQAWVRILE